MTAQQAPRFSEADIRPAELNFDKEAAYARDVARLLAHRSEFVEVPCPACRSAEATPKWTKWTLRYVECASCLTVYISPRPPIPAIEEYYRESELYAYWRERIFPASEAVRMEKIAKPRVARIVDLCRRHGVSTDRLVEVGPGFGTFCEAATASGVFGKVLAIEPTPPLAEACRARGIEVIDKPVEQVDFASHAADVVVAFEVIEHLFDPAAFLEACYRAVRPGGLVTMTCPNVQGFELLVLGAVADTVDTEHLNYFNPGSLSLLFERVGFQVLETQTPGMLDADIVRNKALAGKYDLREQGFLRTVLLDRFEELGEPFQDFLRAQRLSSHMWVAGRRPREAS